VGGLSCQTLAVTASVHRSSGLAFGLACVVLLSTGVALATSAYGKGTTTTVARNARAHREPKLDKLPIAKPAVPRIVSIPATTCTYDPKTDQVLACGMVKWVPTGGGGALGTVTATWSAPATRRRGRHKATPAFSVSATSQQFFYGPWSLSDNMTSKPNRCALTLNFAAPSASSVTAYLQAKGLPITGLIVFNASTDPNHLLGRPTKAGCPDARPVASTFHCDNGEPYRRSGMGMAASGFPSAWFLTRANRMKNLTNHRPSTGSRHVLVAIAHPFGPYSKSRDVVEDDSGDVGAGAGAKVDT
jgi:hypothetical protein